ncbi:MAG: hypothetical protein M1834_005457 [Cirrosporium novae-zelandiae]|nr:MAG: hypothetical protein M1834_005457 [Cirrosporium novae-zelandiae]
MTPNVEVKDTVMDSCAVESPSADESSRVPGEPEQAREAAKPLNNGTTKPTHPPPKTDKPRPHVCITCLRSFARLEHLKRHERSHTKEKPFECEHCTRRFARRDLLLRHQQKLHVNATPPSRPRNGRRESAAGVTNGRVRKNSMASTPGPVTSSMRPRANTINVDPATLGLVAAANENVNRTQHLNMSHGYRPGFSGFNYHDIPVTNGEHNLGHSLPKLETHGLNIDMSGGLRTAPPTYDSDFDAALLYYNHENTINPAQLHFNDSPHSMSVDSPMPPYNIFGGMTTAMLEDDTPYDWINSKFEWPSGIDNQIPFGQNNEQVFDSSSPSGMDTTSPGGMSDGMLDGSNGLPATSSMWIPAVSTAQTPSPFSIDVSGLTHCTPPPGTISPKSLQATNGYPDTYHSPPPMSLMTPANVPSTMSQQFSWPNVINPDSPSTATSASFSGSSHRHSSVTSVSADSITDATRQALLQTLSKPSSFQHTMRKYSQPAISSPLSDSFAGRPRSASGIIMSLPSTFDLQRYVSAYIQYFHPHMPFLHIPTLSFDSPAYTSDLRALNGHPSFSSSGLVGGGGCLILSMAAIGALYEFDQPASSQLFEAAKRMLQLYLEERRKVDMVNATSGGTVKTDNSPLQNTPLWLVQAMLLNVIYGHNCGDKTTSEIATSHCAALVSLARAAELPRVIPPEELPPMSHPNHRFGSISGLDSAMGGINMNSDAWNCCGQQPISDDQREWYTWKTQEERKRTLYAVFILSSLLVSAYNLPPALTNSEILLQLPCDEELWAAENAQEWREKGGAELTNDSSVSFASALGYLITASSRLQQHSVTRPSDSQPFGSCLRSENIPDSELKPSTYGCLVLINALNNYIWETRQRFMGSQWTAQEMDSLRAHFEPALKAWQAAWASNPQHHCSRPNPFGMGPLSADCIPLLDLAYIRLYVNLGRSKEAFWRRDFDGMAKELARGAEVASRIDQSPQTSGSPDSLSSPGNKNSSPRGGTSPAAGEMLRTPTQEQQNPTIISNQASQPCQKRERHLRRAALYAIDSLSMSDKFGITFAEFTSRELPIQSAMCAFDCAQVLAEWVTTVQERVGRHCGILGKDDIDYSAVPSCMFLDESDVQLLEKIQEYLASADTKMTYESIRLGTGAALLAMHSVPSAYAEGFGSKILKVTAHMLEKAAVWPVTKLMAHSLEVQATHVKERAEKSVLLEYQ